MGAARAFRGQRAALRASRSAPIDPSGSKEPPGSPPRSSPLSFSPLASLLGGGEREERERERGASARGRFLAVPQQRADLHERTAIPEQEEGTSCIRRAPRGPQLLPLSGASAGSHFSLCGFLCWALPLRHPRGKRAPWVRGTRAQAQGTREGAGWGAERASPALRQPLLGTDRLLGGLKNPKQPRCGRTRSSQRLSGCHPLRALPQNAASPSPRRVPDRLLVGSREPKIAPWSCASVSRGFPSADGFFFFFFLKQV